MNLYIGKRATAAGDYEIGISNYEWDKHFGFMLAALVRNLCPKDFERITGLKLAPGEIRKVKRIVIEVE